MGAHTISYEEFLIKRLAANPEEAQGYLQAALEVEAPRVHALAKEHVRKAKELRTQRLRSD